MSPEDDYRSVGAAMIRLGRIFNDELLQRLNEAGFDDLRPSHSAVFLPLTERPRRITELGDFAQTTRQAAWEMVAYLEERSYVERVPDPTDKRATLVRLTPLGQRAVEVADGLIVEIEEGWSKVVGARRFAQLRSSVISLDEGLCRSF